MLTLADILAAARQSAAEVEKLCEGMTEEQVRAEIGALARQISQYERWLTGRLPAHKRSHFEKAAGDRRQARAALETVRDDRRKAAMIATLPEDKR